jgi:hypothetical protein
MLPVFVFGIKVAFFTASFTCFAMALAFFACLVVEDVAVEGVIVLAF